MQVDGNHRNRHVLQINQDVIKRFPVTLRKAHIGLGPCQYAASMRPFQLPTFAQTEMVVRGVDTQNGGVVVEADERGTILSPFVFNLKTEA